MVFSVKEVKRIFDEITGIQRLMVMIIYGCGLRLYECLSLRIKDIDLDQDFVIVRSGKGNNDRRTVLSESLKDNPRKDQI